MSSLNPQQKKAAESPAGPLLIVAGAGTGKTHTLTHRFLHLIESGVSPDNICAITFTNKAAKEMSERIRKTVPHLPATLGVFPYGYIGTFHALGAKILRRETPAFGRKKNFAIFDDGDSWSVIKKIAKKYADEKPKLMPGEIGETITHIKNGMLPIEELENDQRIDRQLLLQAYHEYEASLERQNAFDFDDLLEKVVRLFSTAPEVLQKYRKRFTHLLVDEYQDINNIQYELIKLLAGESRNISVVGDQNQTIYSFRGSNINIFLNFPKDWPGSQVIVLEDNYRSSGNILEAASTLIAQNSIRLEEASGKLRAVNPPGPMIQLYEASNEEEEAEWVGGKIQSAIISAEMENSPQQTMAVLYRTNAQSRAIEQTLLARAIPYRVFGGLKFYERLEVRDVIASVRYLSNPEDEVSKTRLEKNITKTKFKLFAEKAGEIRELKPTQAITAFMRTVSYIEHLEKHYLNVSERQENIMELLRFAQNFSTLEDFLEQVSLLQSTDQIKGETPSNLPPVTLSSIHLAKGLEFDEVFLIGVNESILPHARSYGTLAELEEERRLLYVAMTRARKKLSISFHDLPSRFLSELPQELLSIESRNGEIRDFDDEERYITLD